MEAIDDGGNVTQRVVERSASSGGYSERDGEPSNQPVLAPGLGGHHNGSAAERLATLLRERARGSKLAARWALCGIWVLILFGLMLFVGTPYYARIQGLDQLRRAAAGLSESVAVYGPRSSPQGLRIPTEPAMSQVASDPLDTLLADLEQLEEQAREIAKTQGQVAFDAAVQSGRGIDYDAIAARLIGSLFVVFLVRILLQVYRAERRYAAFYDARADALVLGALEFPGYRDAAELMGTDRLLEDAPVTAPYEWLARAVNRFQEPPSRLPGQSS